MPRNEACAIKRTGGSATAWHVSTGAYPASSPDGEKPVAGIFRFDSLSTVIDLGNCFHDSCNARTMVLARNVGIDATEPLDPGSRVDVDASGDALEADSGIDMAS